jgi:hypothetical protein
MLLVINWTTPMENIPEIREKFYKVVQEMFTNSKFTAIGKKIGKSGLENTNPRFIWAFFFFLNLCLKHLRKVAPSNPPPQVKETDPTPIIKTAEAQ